MLARYCNTKGQAAAWTVHGQMCTAPPSKEFTKGCRKLGKLLNTSKVTNEGSWLELTLASGRKVTTQSGVCPTFDISELRDDCKLMMPADMILPDLFSEQFKLYVSLPHWLQTVAMMSKEDLRRKDSKWIVSVKNSVKKWSKSLERLYSRYRTGMPEAVKLYENFVQDILLLIAYRYVYGEASNVFGCLDLPAEKQLEMKAADAKELAPAQVPMFILRMHPFTAKIGQLAVARMTMLECGSCNKVVNYKVDNNVRLQLCNGCRSVKYCSVACQRKMWPQHKAACKAAALKASTQLASSDAST
jgi:hypothetical protein